jgi:hypothetical protein
MKFDETMRLGRVISTIIRLFTSGQQFDQAVKEDRGMCILYPDKLAECCFQCDFGI